MRFSARSMTFSVRRDIGGLTFDILALILPTECQACKLFFMHPSTSSFVAIALGPGRLPTSGMTRKFTLYRRLDLRKVKLDERATHLPSGGRILLCAPPNRERLLA